MNINQNWGVGERIVGLKNKRVELFIRVPTTSRLYELKSSVWDKFLKEEFHVCTKNTKLNILKD